MLNALLRAGNSFLAKPYTVAALAAAVQKALAKRSLDAQAFAAR